MHALTQDFLQDLFMATRDYMLQLNLLNLLYFLYCAAYSVMILQCDKELSEEH